MLNIQKYISCFDDIREANTYLSSKFKIDCIEDTILSSVDHTWYSAYVYVPRLHADLSDPIVQEANCLVLDEYGNLVAKAADIAHEVASPELLPQSFVLEGARVIERGEGSLVTIYNLEGEWYVGGQFSVDAREMPALSKGGLSYNFRVQSFLEFKRGAEWDVRFMNVDPRLCFSFLYTCPEDNRVVPHKHEELVLLDVINLDDGEELPQDRVDSLANHLSFFRPRSRSIHGMNSLRHILKTMQWSRAGITLIDRNGLRVDIENPILRALRNAKNAGARISPTHLVKLYQACRDEVDVLQIVRIFPEYDDLLKLTHDTIDELWGELITLWNTAKREKDDKGFAQMVEHHALKHLLFEYKQGRINNIKEAIIKLKPQKLLASIAVKHDKDLNLFARCLKVDNGGTNGGSEKD